MSEELNHRKLSRVLTFWHLLRGLTLNLSRLFSWAEQKTVQHSMLNALVSQGEHWVELLAVWFLADGNPRLIGLPVT
jgi:predicted thioredoxin/glutaredoxin